MNANRFLLVIAFLITALVTGCKYSVTTPIWDQPYTPPPSASISSINPPLEAKGGINTITINGQNLVVNHNSTVVYFDSYTAQIISMTSSTIVVRRPNIASDSATIKVIPRDAYSEGIYNGYKIDKVLNNYGGFLQNVALSVVAVDKNENLYVVETITKNLHKVTPDGTNTVIATTTYAPFDGKIGPDGNLYLTEKNRAIDKVDLSANKKSKWTTLPSGLVAKYCDFGSNNYFYCGGTGTDLIYFPFDLSSTAVQAGIYANDDIQAIRFYNGYLYVASQDLTTLEPTKIWRDQVNADGSLGSRQLVFDLNTIGNKAVVSGLAFGADGKMYVTTYAAADPMIIIDPSSNSLDIFYKGILPQYCQGICWGNGNYLYMINGNTAGNITWLAYRVDMGRKSGQ
jgi:sugar lactone lactonase YvrE